jgi:anti-anti-sigma factor
VNFIIQKSESHTCITVKEENLDAAIAPGFKSELVLMIENGEKNILVDLSGCIQCDSSGMSALLMGERLCRGVNGRFVIYGLPVTIKEKLDLARIDSLMLLADNRVQAEKYFLK